jgi:hypothetical protein
MQQMSFFKYSNNVSIIYVGIYVCFCIHEINDDNDRRDMRNELGNFVIIRSLPPVK